MVLHTPQHLVNVRSHSANPEGRKEPGSREDGFEDEAGVHSICLRPRRRFPLL